MARATKSKVKGGKATRRRHTEEFKREALGRGSDGRATIFVLGQRVAELLEHWVTVNRSPVSITVDHGTEFTSRALEAWA